MNDRERDETRDDPTLPLETSDTPNLAELGPRQVDSADTQHIEHPTTQQIEQMPTEHLEQAGNPDNAHPATHDHETTGSAMTQHDPAPHGPAPFTVEPATPVPDDAVRAAEGAPSLPHLQSPPPPAQPVAPAPQWSPPSQGLVRVRRGPLPLTIMLGLLSIIVAGFVFVTNLAGRDLDMRTMGPMVFASFGGLLLVVGLIGVLAGGRSRGTD
ncbi:hypothetical protein [Intrasporangium sp.]|uniref:hypothetical protein n=1 Tax=Intrasporangium sp. TaxID=1925024 RepID=UPI00293ACE94|nr:hypothetical protein [Intrasporangium sp.]MDV3220361.1 hypothetical protein [Intrasporangium sp.]